MKAVVCRVLEGPDALVIEEKPSPKPGPGQVLVRVRAASVNFPDYLMTKGLYQLKPDLPFTPGMEAAGDIMALGEGVTGWSVGDRVVATMRFGAFAEEVLANADNLMAIPPGFDYATGCAFPAAYSTAWVALRRRDYLKPGEVLLVHGAAGGVGLAAVELGRHFGARVIATVGDDAKADVVRRYGADLVINYRNGFREKVLEATGGKGADVIYDPVGGDVFDESTRCIAWGGRILIIGFAGGRIADLKTNIALIKGFSVVGVRAGEFARRDPEAGRENVAALLRLCAEGRINPHVSHRLPMKRAAEAMKVLAERRVIGKCVLEM
jgi:NADPH2:quinone reductase